MKLAHIWMDNCLMFMTVLVGPSIAIPSRANHERRASSRQTAQGHLTTSLFPFPFVTMLDHLAGRPSANWKRTQIIITLCTRLAIPMTHYTVHSFDTKFPLLVSLFLLLNGKKYRWPRTLGLENRTLSM